MKTGILFDLDGTLLDTLEDLADAVNLALAEFRFPARSICQVREFVGNGAGQLIRLAVPEGTAPEIVCQVLAAFRRHYAQNCRCKTRPYPGISKVLAELSREYPIAIVSNKPDSAVKELCAFWFPGIFALGEGPDCPRKPAPDMVRKAMDSIGVEGCVYVGDSEVDVLTAKNAGVTCLSVLWGFRDTEVLIHAGAAHFCQEPAGMAQALRDILSGL